MVAAAILVVGVLGTVALVGVATQQTVGASGLQSATNIARRVLEVASSLPARSLTQANAASQIQAAAPDLATSATDGSWTLQRGGMTYTIATNVCYVDDPSDQMVPVSQRDSSFCAGQPTPTAAQLNPPDPQPLDYKRFGATVTWNVGAGKHSVTQATTISTRGNADLPAVSTLAMTSPSSCSSSCPAITSQSTTTAWFSANTTNFPSTFTWLVQGNPQQTCPPNIGSGANTCSQQSSNAFAFSWGLGTPVTATDPVTGTTKCTSGNYTYDGTYNVGARAQDSNGNAGPDVSLPVTVNRCAPIGVPNLVMTSRSSSGNFSPPVIDLEWTPNPEGDVVGYRVYRGAGASGGTLVCSSVPGDSPSSTGLMPAPGYLPTVPTTCTDSNAPTEPNGRNPSPFYYAVVAVDRDPSGNLREGMYQYANVNGGSSPPSAPTGLSISVSSGAATLRWTKPSGSNVQGFRIYRRSGNVTETSPSTVTQRYDRDTVSALCASGSQCTWTDTSDARTSGPYTYTVTTIDANLQESTFSGSVSG